MEDGVLQASQRTALIKKSRREKEKGKRKGAPLSFPTRCQQQQHQQQQHRHEDGSLEAARFSFSAFSLAAATAACSAFSLAINARATRELVSLPSEAQMVSPAFTTFARSTPWPDAQEGKQHCKWTKAFGKKKKRKEKKGPPIQCRVLQACTPNPPSQDSQWHPA